MPELTCPKCQSQLPQDSKYCNQCGKMVGFDAPSEKQGIETINSYTQFLKDLHGEQMNMFKRILSVIVILTLGCLAILGLGPYAFTSTIQESVDKSVKYQLTPEKIEGLADKIATKLIQEKLSEMSASAKHDSAYVMIQLAKLNGKREKLNHIEKSEKDLAFNLEVQLQLLV